MNHTPTISDALLSGACKKHKFLGKTANREYVAAIFHHIDRPNKRSLDYVEAAAIDVNSTRDKIKDCPDCGEASS